MDDDLIQKARAAAEEPCPCTMRRPLVRAAAGCRVGPGLTATDEAASMIAQPRVASLLDRLEVYVGESRRSR